ncbi:J domain-containing protein [Maricaulis sp. CAU 1757]
MVRMLLGGGALLAGLVMVLRGAAPLGIPVGLFGLSMLGLSVGQGRGAQRGGNKEHRGDRDSGRAVPREGAMTEREAREILGLGPEATAEEIRQAHRNLMKKLHPDTGGGSTGLARQVQEARDVLLGSLDD